MMGTSIGTILPLVLAAGMVLAPPQARAQGLLPGGSANHSFAPAPAMAHPPVQPFAPAPAVARPPMQPFAPAPAVAHPAVNGSRRPFHSPFHERFPFRAPAIVFSSPSVVYYGVPYLVPSPYDYGYPPAYDPAPAYDPSPAYDPAPAYDPPAVYEESSTAQDPSSTPSVIQYPTGRYELRGDGVATRYTWVWIPNPPPPPPVAAPDQPAMSDPPPMLSPGASPPARRAAVYRWTDAEGVVHFTDSLDAVPYEYRAQTKLAPSS